MAVSIKTKDLPAPTQWRVVRNLGMSVITLCLGPESKCRQFIAEQHRQELSEFNGTIYVM
jgi:hypothetical protein